jgi:Coenzyme PQQ synthesis protein D (PqqD)
MGRRFRPGSHVFFQDLDEEVVLLNLSSGIYYGAGAVGARIWKLMLEGKSPEEIVAQVVCEYDTSVDQATADVTAFLGDLERLNLLECHDS